MSFVGKDISRTNENAPTLNKTRPMKSLTRHWICTGKLIQLTIQKSFWNNREFLSDVSLCFCFYSPLKYLSIQSKS